MNTPITGENLTGYIAVNRRLLEYVDVLLEKYHNKGSIPGCIVEFESMRYEVEDAFWEVLITEQCSCGDADRFYYVITLEQLLNTIEEFRSDIDDSIAEEERRRAERDKRLQEVNRERKEAEFEKLKKELGKE